jgi:hypothetical protein
VNAGGTVEAMVLIGVEAQDVLCDFAGIRCYTRKVQETLGAESIAVVWHFGRGFG